MKTEYCCLLVVYHIIVLLESTCTCMKCMHVKSELLFCQYTSEKMAASNLPALCGVSVQQYQGVLGEAVIHHQIYPKSEQPCLSAQKSSLPTPLLVTKAEVARCPPVVSALCQKLILRYSGTMLCPTSFVTWLHNTV